VPRSCGGGWRKTRSVILVNPLRVLLLAEEETIQKETSPVGSLPKKKKDPASQPSGQGEFNGTRWLKGDEINPSKEFAKRE